MGQDIVIPESYPFQPVKMKFITKVYHPNVSSASGAICLDILKDAWSPVLTLKSTLISLQSLLCSPEPNDPQDAEVAKHYMTSRSSFEETARYWTRIYAGGPADESKSGQDPVAIAGLEKAHVDRFEALGFPRDKVVSFNVVHGSLLLFDRAVTVTFVLLGVCISYRQLMLTISSSSIPD
jgi:ubiquitin-conjugating enzyme (huntingtin interacting protein 2)